MARASRARFVRNFPSQNSEFDFGTVARRHPVCWCQKHPFTKIAHRRDTFAKSGLPGSDLTFRR